MKKSIILLPVFLIFVFIFFSVIDRSDYALEKMIWLTQKQFNLFALNPKSIPEYQYQGLIKRYRDLISSNYTSRLLPKLYMNLGDIYAIRGDFQLARFYYSDIISRYSKESEFSAPALMDIGLTYEKENKIDQAVETFWQVVEDYPNTRVGINAPIYIVKYYIRLNRKEDANAALIKAEEFYKQVIVENHNSSLSFYAKGFLARVYLAEERWDDSITLLKNILDDYALSPYLNEKIVSTIIRSINQVSIEKLNDINRPIEIYQCFIRKYPGHPLNKVLSKMVVYLQNL